MHIRSNLKVGQATPSQETNAQAVLNEMVGSLQKDIENLRIWSMIRVKGPGVSSWTVLSQKPQPETTNQA